MGAAPDDQRLLLEGRMNWMTVNAVWFLSSLALLWRSIAFVRRRFLRGSIAPYVRFGIRVFGTAAFLFVTITFWILFDGYFSGDKLWTAILVNIPNVFTASLWAGIAFGWGVSLLRPGSLG